MRRSAIAVASREEQGCTLQRAPLLLPQLAFLAVITGLVVGARTACAYDQSWQAATADSVADDRSARDDWEVVPPDSAADPGGAIRRSDTNSSAANEPRAFVACGEPSAKPSPEIIAIVARINQLWGTRVHVYQSLAPLPPHAAHGGCIFYNDAALNALMGSRLQVRDGQIAGPLLYAIFAHEVGHELHHDLDPARANVPSRIKELEADRFAGYTLQRLEIPASGLAPYWSMAGDEFGGGAAHGTSSERVNAFQQGWNLSEWNRPESSATIPAHGDPADFGAVAPDEASGAP